MGRIHTGYDVYIGHPDAPYKEHPLAFKAATLFEDIQHKTMQVKVRNDKRQFDIVYEATGLSKMSRNGTALQWTATSDADDPVTLTAISNRGGCIPCGRR